MPKSTRTLEFCTEILLKMAAVRQKVTLVGGQKCQNRYMGLRYGIGSLPTGQEWSIRQLNRGINCRHFSDFDDLVDCEDLRADVEVSTRISVSVYTSCVNFV